MSTRKLRCLSPHALFFLDLEVGGQEGLRRESRKSFAVNAGFLLFGWSASIPFDHLALRGDVREAF
jgi:hypothetical protein